MGRVCGDSGVRKEVIAKVICMRWSRESIFLPGRMFAYSSNTYGSRKRHVHS